MKVLLVGATGFLGAPLSERLILDGHYVWKLNSQSFQGKGFFDFQGVSTLMSRENFDCVISTAWETERDTYRHSENNLRFSEATVHLAYQSSLCGVKSFVALGSAAEYGANNQSCDSELSDLNPQDNYSFAKVETFNRIKSLFDLSSTNFLWARIFQPYGINQDPVRLLPALIRAHSSGAPLTLNQPFVGCDWISKTDIVDALIFGIYKGVNGVVDIGTGRLTSNQELAFIVEKCIKPDLSTEFPEISASISGLSVAQNSRLFREGWSPKIALEDGILDLVRSGRAT